MSGELADRTWTELEASPAGLLLVPIGATEQHGPHLPLSTDTEIAVALARGALEEIGDALLAPPVAFGSSGEHADFPGTLSIGAEATELLLVELCRSASRSIPRIVLVSAHGGNADPLARAVARLRGEGRQVLAWSPSWGGDAHAGRIETSLMLALDPERVRLDRARAGNPEPLQRLIGELRAGGVRPLAANGVLGDPEGAGAEEGRELLARAVGELLAAVEAWRREPVELAAR
ncbi:MAG: mycofactocin biosynthesis peptidyl-dipeptidase MftE [Solirubrobacterales bacterium]